MSSAAVQIKHHPHCYDDDCDDADCYWKDHDDDPAPPPPRKSTWAHLMRQILYRGNVPEFDLDLAASPKETEKRGVRCPLSENHKHGDRSPSAVIIMGKDFAGLHCFVCGQFGVLDLGVKCGYAKTREEVAQKLRIEGFPVPASPQSLPKTPALQSAVKDSAIRRLHVVRASDLRSVAIDWFLPGYIPFGAFCLLQGDGGIGKTTVVLDLIARASTARKMPDGTRPFESPRASIVIAGEDSGSTLKARLLAAGANMDMVNVVRWVGDEKDKRPFTLPDDLDLLREQIAADNAALVYIDSLFDVVSLKLDTNKDQEVRAALTPLADVAEEAGAVILGTRHIKKEGNGRAAHRGMGSVAFSNRARSVLHVAPHPGEAGSYLVSVAKRNYGKDAQSLKYRIEDAIVTLDDDKPSTWGKIKWLGFDAITADEAANASPTKFSLAKAAIVRAVETKGSFRIEVLSRETGASDDTLRRAMEEITAERSWRFQKKKRGFGEGSYWEYLAEQ